MPLPFLTAGVKFRCSGVQGAGEFGMVFHWLQESGADITDADATSFANAIAAGWAAHISPVLPETTSLTSVVVEGLSSATDGVGAWAGTNSGTSPEPSTPAQVCVLEKDIIARRYRGGHPRHYWPAPTTDNMANSTTLTSGAVVGWTSAVAGFLGAVGTEAGTLWGPGSNYASASYYTGHALRPIPLADPIVGWSIESKVASQRRRIGR